MLLESPAGPIVPATLEAAGLELVRTDGESGGLMLLGSLLIGEREDLGRVPVEAL